MRFSKITKEQIAQAIVTRPEEDDSVISIETGLLNSYSRTHRILWKSKKEGFLTNTRTSILNRNTKLYEIKFSNKTDKANWRPFSLFANPNRGDSIMAVPETTNRRIEAFIVENNFKNTRLVYIPDQLN